MTGSSSMMVTNEMRILTGLMLLLLSACAAREKPPAPPTPPGMLRVADAELVLALPEGWHEMSRNLYEARGFSAGFQKGTDPEVSSSYFLIKVRDEPKWPEQRLKSLAESAAALNDAQDLVGYITGRHYESRPELYTVEHDMFLHIMEYRVSRRSEFSVMAKRFCDRHQVVFHFYFHDKLPADVDVLDKTLDSVVFDEDRSAPPKRPQRKVTVTSVGRRSVEPFSGAQLSKTRQSN